MVKSKSVILSALLFILLAFAAFPPTAMSQNTRVAIPKIAVYVAGKPNPGMKNILTTTVLNALIKSGKFEAIERSEAFLAQVEGELEKQYSGDINDSQISALGKQSGVEFVCVLDANYINGTYMVSARIINVETAKVATMGVADSRLSSAEEYSKAADELVAKLLNQPTSKAQEPAAEAAAPSGGDVEVVIVGPGDTFGSGTLTVSIDGESYGSMRGDGTLKIMVPSGTRLMTVKWQGKDTSNETQKPFKFTAKKGKKSMFKVEMKVFSPIKVTAMN